MLVFVMYDISDTATRTSFIKKLQYFGLYRVQKSVFTGFLDVKSRLDLVDVFDFYLSSDKDSIILVPVCKNCRNSINLEGPISLPKKQDFLFI